MERSGERLERMLMHAHAVDVGDGGERRGNSLPREGLQLCVAPNFADLGVGDMRGPPMGAPKMPPRRRWQAVIAPHDPMSHTRDTQHVARNTMVEATASHHLRGAIWVERFGTPRMSPRPRVAKYGVSHSCHRLPGWRKCTPPVIISAAEGRYRPTNATR